MWAQQGSPLLMEAERKARALWQTNKPWNKDRYLDHQLLIQKEFAATKKADVMDPILTSPFPRWTKNWQSQSVGRELFGVVLPTMETIKKHRFCLQCVGPPLGPGAKRRSGDMGSRRLRREPEQQSQARA